MTHKELHEKVAKFVHGQDSHGDYLVPYQHDNCCTWCDRLTEFIERLFLESNTFKNPLAKDAPLPYFMTHAERSEKFRAGGLSCNCPTCKSHRVP